MKSIKNSSYTIGNNGFVDISNEILAKPIGIVRRNHKLIEETLHRNIGNCDYKFDGFGTAISDNSQTNLNSFVLPWFKTDLKKNEYGNYIEYFNYVYGSDSNFRFPTNTDDLLMTDKLSVLNKISTVGVIRGYDFNKKDNVLSPNHEHDTRLGFINNHYLSTTLLNAYRYYEKLGKKEITNNIYNNFDTYGTLGIANGFSSAHLGRVMDNIEIHNAATGIMPRLFHDFIDYGTYVDSEVLMINTDKLTREFIIKSLLGIDLSKRDIKVSIDSLNIDWSLVSQKRYYPSKSGFDYLSQTFGNGLVYKTNKELHNDLSHNNVESEGILSVYREYGGNNSNFDVNESYNSGINYGSSKNFIIDESRNDLVSFTNDKFASGEYKSIMARFHTDNTDPHFLQTSSAVSQYGMSRGRNLLKKNHFGSETNGYSDPYCRVWTFHKQYSKLDNLIRPFSGKDKRDLDDSLKNSYQVNRNKITYGSVKQTNGLVQIAPTNGDKTNLRKCMFSIENLAWKHERELTYGYEDQIGPLGGRIMWFPPYDLKFNENVSVNWNPNNFIGRGEPIYTYTNTERSGNLSFKLLIDHPSLINKFRGGEGPQGVDDTESTEQTLLRFFAGCEVLKYDKKETNEELKMDDNLPTPIPIMPIISEDKRIVFYVFFPNNYSGVDDDANGEVKPMHYLINGLGSSWVRNENGVHVQLPTSFVNYGEYGGYEMGKHGISCVDSYIPKFNNNAMGEPITVVQGNTLVPQVGFGTKNGNILGGNIRLWAYRVDSIYGGQILTEVDNKNNIYNYADIVSYGLNNVGYTKLLDYHKDAEEYYKNYELYSFNDVFSAFEKDYKSKANDMYANESFERVLELNELLSGYEIASVEYQGFASSAGYKTENDVLGKNRAKSVHEWLKSCDKRFTDKYTYKTNEIGKVTSKDINALDHKVYRCTKVIITLTQEEVTSLYESGNLTEGNINYINSLLNKYGDTIYGQMLNGVEVNKDMYSQLTQVQMNALFTLVNMDKEKSENSLEEAVKNGSILKGKHNIETYGKEYEFFEEITKNDTILHHRLKDKIKYFDPAFHSISPEGFNARLNFLHQCTRQGSTYSFADNDKNVKTARNLAFGAPPVCVLRLGDFFNTKIIIESLNITYDDTTWDLNDEGIGVMPMLADINITFKFLGGSDMTGPISRLQNAVSFNYYANTIAYDDRAEEIFYDKDGKINNIKTKQ